MRLIFVVLLVVGHMAGPVFAVVPPSTVLEAEAQDNAVRSAEKAEYRRSHAVIERLEEDVQRLEDVLKNLTEDIRALKGSSKTTNPAASNAGPQK